MILPRKHTAGSFLKAAPAGLFKADYQLKGYATVEVKDREGDIIRVAGLTLDNHREAPIKVLGTAHAYKPLSDGTYPIVAVVKEFTPTTRTIKGREVPALAFGADYATGEDGAITPYAAKFKAAYESEALSAFSVGVEPAEGFVKELKGGRFDVTRGDIFEVSCCLVGMNPYATALKSLSDLLGDDLSHADYLDQKISELARRHDDRLAALLKSLNDRLDTFESRYVAASRGRTDPTGDHPDSSTPKPEAADLSPLAKALEAFAKSLQK